MNVQTPTAFGPALIGQTEKALDAILVRELDGTGVSAAGWVVLKLADGPGEHLGRQELVDRANVQAKFPAALGNTITAGINIDTALATVKSFKEAIDLQSSYSKATMAKALAESTKLTEASMKLTEQAMAPITARMAVAVGSLSKAA